MPDWRFGEVWEVTEEASGGPVFKPGWMIVMSLGDFTKGGTVNDKGAIGLTSEHNIQGAIWNPNQRVFQNVEEAL